MRTIWRQPEGERGSGLFIAWAEPDTNIAQSGFAFKMIIIVLDVGDLFHCGNSPESIGFHRCHQSSPIERHLPSNAYYISSTKLVVCVFKTKITGSMQMTSNENCCTNIWRLYVAYITSDSNRDINRNTVVLDRDREKSRDTESSIITSAADCS